MSQKSWSNHWASRVYLRQLWVMFLFFCRSVIISINMLPCWIIALLLFSFTIAQQQYIGCNLWSKKFILCLLNCSMVFFYTDSNPSGNIYRAVNDTLNMQCCLNSSRLTTATSSLSSFDLKFIGFDQRFQSVQK